MLAGLSVLLIMAAALCVAIVLDRWERRRKW